jgi:hypothetical protein
MTHIFQTEFPAAEAQTIAAAILSKTFSKSLIRDAWVVAEYGLSMIVPAAAGNAEVVKDVHACSEHEAMEALLAASQPGNEQLATALPPLPWAVIFKVILQAILTFL